DGTIAADVEGLTLLGGEPFDQAAACAELARGVRAAGLGVIVFTGYEHEYLQKGERSWRDLLAEVDLLVDGPYRHDAPEADRSLVGSTNQRFIHLTDRYRDFDPNTHPNRLDIRIDPFGETRMAGFLTRPQLKKFI
ncbi:MAG TPA: 4Fe-4S single cluster domain-containing protein, partial [Microthrixaceae bacterium]|nr:4Fe-4S single cluster domain-containing protein [Microthrixaceae bacterium]